MTDARAGGAPHDHENVFGTGEPVRDDALGALLSELVGAPPVHEVEWEALSARIAAARTAQRTASWWTHAARWERHALPLALAASLAGVLALWSLGSPEPVSALAVAPDPLAVLVDGTPAAEAARSYLQSEAVADAATTLEVY